MKNQISELFPLGDISLDPGARGLFQLSGRCGDPITAIGMGIGGIGSIVNAFTGSDAASDAAKTLSTAATGVTQNINNATTTGQAGVQTATTGAQNYMTGGVTNANQTLQNVYTGQTNNLNPYLAAGTQGVNSLSQMMAPGGALTTQFTAPSAADVLNTPGYQFAYDQGQKAISNSAAARGGAVSGAAMKQGATYATGLANQYYGDAYNRALNTFQTNRTNTLSGLQALTNLGQFGTQQYNQAGQNYGNTTANNLMSAAQYMGNTGVQGAEYSGNLGLQGAQAAGNATMQGAGATAAGQMGAANATMNAVNGISGAVGTAAASYNNPYGGYGMSPYGGYGAQNPPSGTGVYGNPYTPVGAPTLYQNGAPYQS
jgi:hypothetical protein